MSLNYPHSVLLVDDEPSIIKALQRLLRKEGWTIMAAGSGPEALAMLEQCGGQVSLIVSDQRMPGMNGAQLLEKAVSIAPDAMRFLLTGYSDMEAVVDAVNKGKIHRYINKPWNDTDFIELVRSALAQVELRLENARLTELTERQNAELSRLNKELEQKVSQRTWALQYQNKMLQTANSSLEKSLVDTVRLLVSLVESSNPKLGGYMKEVGRLARDIARQSGLDEKQQNTIEMAGLVHDIGLLGMPEQILQKDRKIMSRQEFEVYSQHPMIASLSLSSVDGLKEIADIVLSHHENINGKGFPRGLAADQIPLGARILAVAADYVTIVSLWPGSIQELISCARRYLDPQVAGAIDINDADARQEVAEKIIRQGVEGRYDAQVIESFLQTLARRRPYQKKRHLADSQLTAGMILLQDLRLKDGRLLLPKGTVLNDRSVESIQTIGQRGLIEGAIEVGEPLPPDPALQTSEAP
jgi:response regulator RpfG family c-di-GMP phosphodiesterase